jgi:hypothetical protein
MMPRGRHGSALIRPNSKIRLLLPLSAFFSFFSASAPEERWGGEEGFGRPLLTRSLSSIRPAATRRRLLALNGGGGRTVVDDAKPLSWRCRRARAPRSHAGTNLPARPCACRSLPGGMAHDLAARAAV